MAEEPEIKLPTYHRESKEFEKNIYFCLIDYAKVFDCVDHKKKKKKNCGKFLKRQEYQITLPVS